MITAARIAKLFGLDPIAILDDGGDELLNDIRRAAAEIVNDDERKAAEAQRSSGRRPRR